MSSDLMSRDGRTPGTPLIDPRLRDRRIGVARDKGRQRLRRVLVVALVLAVVAGAYAITRSPLLDVDEITVAGAPRTGSDAVIAASGLERGEPMLSLDTGAAETALEELPWVETASVSRSWPGSVEISIDERVPVAITGSGANAVIIDAQGRVLGLATDDLTLPAIEGAGIGVGEELPSRGRALAALLGELPTDVVAELADARSVAGGYEFTLTDDIVVRWGNETQVKAKSEALRVLLEQADRSTIATIDVSVPLASTLTRNNEVQE